MPVNFITTALLKQNGDIQLNLLLYKINMFSQNHGVVPA